jgi:hypothetical protein
MNFARRMVAGLILVLATAMLLISLAGGIGVWIIKQPVTEKVNRVVERVEAALEVAEGSLEQVKASLTRAQERLDSAREDQRKLAQEPQPGGALRRKLARTVQQRLAPELDDAHERLHTVAEAAVVVNTVLEDVGNLPMLSVSGLDLDRLSEMNRRLADVGPAAWELSRLLGDPGSDSDAAGNQQSQVERTVQTLLRFVAEFEPRLSDVRQRTDDLKSKMFRWLNPAAVVISGVCFWIALSQVSLMAHAWSWWKRSGSAASGPL